MVEAVISSVVLVPSDEGWRFRVCFNDGTEIGSELPYQTRTAALQALQDALFRTDAAKADAPGRRVST